MKALTSNRGHNCIPWRCTMHNKSVDMQPKKKEADSVVIPPEKYWFIKNMITSIYRADPQATQKTLYYRYQDSSELNVKITWKVKLKRQLIKYVKN